MAEKRKTPEEYLKELEQKHFAANRRVTQAKEDVLRMQSVLVDTQQSLTNVLYEIVAVKEQIAAQKQAAAAVPKPEPLAAVAEDPAEEA